MRVQCIVAFICTLVALLPTAALSDQNEQDNDWQFELSPFYLWAISVDGDMGVRGRAANVQVDFKSVWDNLEGALTVRFNTIYRDKFGVMVDFNYLDIGTEKISDAVNTDVGFKSQFLNLAATYRLLSTLHTVDAIAGIRYTSMDVGFTFNNLGQRFDTDYNWTDPIIGLRYNYLIHPQWSLRLFGDIGGFGVGSDFTWQGVVMLKYQPWRNVKIVAGYRAIGADYESSGANNFTYDAVINGPLIGLDIRF